LVITDELDAAGISVTVMEVVEKLMLAAMYLFSTQRAIAHSFVVLRNKWDVA
jgi:hypothetical protein